MNNEIPIPRIRGNAIPFGDKWGWEMMITIGDSEPICMSFPGESGEGAIATKDEAIAHLKKYAQDVANTISRDVYKAEPIGFMDLTRNVMVKKLDG